MRRLLSIALGGFLLAGATGCTDFLTKDGVGSDKDPNNPREATRDQLFVAAQAAQFGMQEANIGMMACLFMQQCGGVGGRFVQFRGWYFFTEIDANGEFIQTYGGGGLLDLRTIQEISEEQGDRVYAGVAKILEAMLIGLTADVFGDIPYREAAQTGTIEQPAFDPQAQVYADVQALLTEAIADIQSGAGEGPAAVYDLVHRADFDKWVEAAYTLKARFYLHTVELPNDGVNLTAYQNAISAANNGISSPANDFRAFHGSATSERNIWYQFSQTTFGQDIVAGMPLAQLMVARNDPRLDDYFGLNANGGYGGYDAPTDGPADQDEISPFTGSLRNVPNFRQPLITWEENQLILAEAKLMTQSIAAAQAHLDAVRAQYGLLPVPATLENIMLEKYVALFQNIEVWNDYKRTCFPNLTPVPDADFGHGFGDEIPGRLFYGSTEMNANPNTPSVAEQLQNGGVAGGRPGVGGFRNPNDPNACP